MLKTKPKKIIYSPVKTLIYLLSSAEFLCGSFDVFNNLKLVLESVCLTLDVLKGHVDDGHHHVDQDHVHHNWT